MNIRETIKKTKLKKIIEPFYRFYQKIKFFFLEIYAKVIGFKTGKKRLKLLSDKKANELLIKMINSNKPFMVARYGGTEFSNLFFKNKKYLNELVICSGFFPKNINLIKKFREIYKNSSTYLDVLAIWIYKRHFFKKMKLLKDNYYLKDLIDLEILNPFKAKWINALEGKRVLIIHPFKKSILLQYKKKEIKIIPKFKSLKIIKAVQTIVGQKDERFSSWFEALNYMKKEIDKNKDNFDIALIGCGAYGFPLAAYIKSKGKQAIHLGGSLQLLFGIKGKRWEEQEKMIFPKNWIYPLPEDTPKKNKLMEGGAYW